MQEVKQWVCTDDDCLQYRLDELPGCYRFVQIIRVDALYYVVASQIHVAKMTREEIEEQIQPFYGSIKEMEKSYHQPIENLMYLVAECTFENIGDPYSYAYCSTPLRSFKKAKKIVEAYIGQKIA